MSIVCVQGWGEKQPVVILLSLYRSELIHRNLNLRLVLIQNQLHLNPPQSIQERVHFKSVSADSQVELLLEL